MSFSIHFKAETLKKSPQLSRVRMIIHKTDWNRVPKILNITGNTADWNPDSERFEGSTTENIELNLRITEIHKKYTKLAEDWENANMEWEPRHLSHYFDDPKNLAVSEQKILTVCQVYDRIINRHKDTSYIRQGVAVTREPYGKSFEYNKKYVTRFVREKFGRDFSTYYFPEIDEEFIQHFAFYIENEALLKGNKGDFRGKMYRLYNVVEEAQKLNIRGANLLKFGCVSEKFKETGFDPRTIPYELFLQIEYIRMEFTVPAERVSVKIPFPSAVMV